MPNQNNRPRYYERCIAIGMMMGVRVIDRLVHEPMKYPLCYPYRSYAIGENVGPGQVHRGKHGDLKCLGRAYESALMRSGWMIRKEGVVPFIGNAYQRRELEEVRCKSTALHSCTTKSTDRA